MNKALIVVEVQNDFLPGGTLGVNNADKIIPIINKIIPKFYKIVFTQDAHPVDHCSFSDNPKFVDKSWPKHCVRGTKGFEISDDIKLSINHLKKIDSLINVLEGVKKDKETYSAFTDYPQVEINYLISLSPSEETGINLADELKNINIDTVYVCGIAMDYCVVNTAVDAFRNGFKTYLIEDACAGVNPETSKRALKRMKDMGIIMIRSDEIL